MAVIKRTRADIAFDWLNNSILILIGIIVIYPILFVLIASISSPEAVNSGKVLFYPDHIDFSSYKAVFKDPRILMGYRNTVLYTLFGTILNVTLTLMSGYSLSRKDLCGRNWIMGILVFTMYFHGGLIPTYLVVRSLHLYNSPLVIIILGAVSVYNIIITRTFFQSTIPSELLEAAFMDGCGNWRFFTRIALPLSKAVIAVLVLFYAVGHWNAFFNALIYLTKSQYMPLQVVLREILVANQMSNDMVSEASYETMDERLKIAEMMKYSVIVVSTLPVLAMYPFAQKYFVKGVMVGSIKG